MGCAGYTCTATARKVLRYRARKQITDWEELLNGSNNKQKLVSRYLYEHLFRAYPSATALRVSSGWSFQGNCRDCAFDDPGKTPFFYRLRAYHASIVAKNHVVYELSPDELHVLSSCFWNLNTL